VRIKCLCLEDRERFGPHSHVLSSVRSKQGISENKLETFSDILPHSARTRPGRCVCVDRWAPLTGHAGQTGAADSIVCAGIQARVNVSEIAGKISNTLSWPVRAPDLCVCVCVGIWQCVCVPAQVSDSRRGVRLTKVLHTLHNSGSCEAFGKRVGRSRCPEPQPLCPARCVCVCVSKTSNSGFH